jgi:succinate dehydrogenase / fumarate reductase flavoprotein subunit/L-aspartate oxidase
VRDSAFIRRARGRQRRQGLASAVSAGALRRAGSASRPETTLQACNSAKAQGGIQAAFGEDDSPEIHAEDVMRSSHETANPRLVEVLTSEAQSAIHWLEQLESSSRVERRLPARPLRRRDAAAAAPGRRPHGPRHHEVTA